MKEEEVPNYSLVREIHWEEPGTLSLEQRVLELHNNLRQEFERLDREVRDLRRQLQKITNNEESE